MRGGGGNGSLSSFPAQWPRGPATATSSAARVPPRVRAGLFWHMFYHAAPTAALWPLIEEVLVSPEIPVTGSSGAGWSLLDAGIEDPDSGRSSRDRGPEDSRGHRAVAHDAQEGVSAYWEDGPADEDEEEEGAEEGAEGRETTTGKNKIGRENEAKG